MRSQRTAKRFSPKSQDGFSERWSKMTGKIAALKEGKVVLVKDAELRSITQSVFEQLDFPREDAALMAEVLVWANMHGKDSHGVMRVPRYIELVKSGEMVPKPNFTVPLDIAAMTIIDAGRAAGPIALQRSVPYLVGKARRNGISLALIRDTTHTGPIGYFTSLVASHGLASIAATASTPNMAYHGTRSAVVSTAPLAISVPRALTNPITLDMASSSISLGKLLAVRKEGGELGANEALDEDGWPTKDPSIATTLAPLGGAKGSGLALIIECLASIMAEKPILQEYLTNTNRRHRQNTLFIAIDVSQLSDYTKFVSNVEAIAAEIKVADRQAGVEELFMPGERGEQIAQRRAQTGIPIPADLLSRLQSKEISS